MIVGMDGRKYRSLTAAINAHLQTPRRRWRAVDGPDSGCGIDYWFVSGKDQLYVNVDQGEMGSCQLLGEESP